MNSYNINNQEIIKILNTNNISNMNNKILKFNSGQYKGKTSQEITSNKVDLTNILNSN